jgi:hypothetical protein
VVLAEKLEKKMGKRLILDNDQQIERAEKRVND